MLFLGDPFRHTNSTCMTHNAAEVTTYALGANDTRQAGGGVEADGLVASVHTRDVAAPAPDALLAVDFRIDERGAGKGARRSKCCQL